MTVGAYRVLDYARFTAEGSGRGWAMESQIVRHFQIPPDAADEKHVRGLLDSLVVSGFLVRDKFGYVRLTDRRMSGDLAEEIDTTGVAPLRPPAGHRIVGGVIISPDGYGEGGVVISGGPGAQGWHADLPAGDQEISAYFSDQEDIGQLRKIIRRALAASRRGQEFERAVAGTDIGDVVVRSNPRQGLTVSILPWEWKGQEQDLDEEEADEKAEDPYADVPVDWTDDDTGQTTPYTQAERDEMAKDALAERAQRSERRAVQRREMIAARPDLTSNLTTGQAEDLLAALLPRTADGQLAPSAVIPAT